MLRHEMIEPVLHGTPFKSPCEDGSVLIGGGVVKRLCELDGPAALLIVEAGDPQDGLPALQAQMFHECCAGADGGYALFHASG